MREKIIISLSVVSLLFFSSFPTFAADEASCIKCHTNDAMMKSLYKPLPMPAGEGEG
jgi:hypothetical protein